MPNWSQTTIHARDSKQYQDLIAELKNHNAKAYPSFNNIIPMPSELMLQQGSIAESVVLIYIKALAVKLIRFNQQHDKINATKIRNYLKAYKTGITNMEYALGFDERLHAIDDILMSSNISSPSDIHSLKDALKHLCQDFTDNMLQADDNRSKLKELINDAIILPKNASNNPYKLAAQYNLTANDKWLDTELKNIPYLITLYNLGKKYFDNVVKYYAETWYGWSTRNWGTKWDLSEYVADNDTNTIMFNTAWSTPVPILKKLAALHGNFNIEVYDEGTPNIMLIRVTKDELEDIRHISVTKIEIEDND